MRSGAPGLRGESNIVDRHIRTLRVKLNDDYRRPQFIATSPGQGYRFVPTFSNKDGTAGRTPDSTRAKAG